MSEFSVYTDAFDQYEKHGILPNVPADAERFDIWRCTFQKYPDVWEMIALEEAKSNIQKSVNNFDSAMTNDPTCVMTMLSAVALFAGSCLNAYSFYPVKNEKRPTKKEQVWSAMFGRLHQKIKEMWLTAFEQYPKFPPMIEQY